MNNIRIQRKSAVPLMQQLRDRILEHVKDNGLSENDRLPSERDMASAIGINVNTVAKVYRQLVDEGYLSREVGKGTFVRSSLTKGKILFLLYHRHLQPGALFGRLLTDSAEELLRKKGYASETIEVPYRNDAWLDDNRTLISRLLAGAFSGVFTGGIALTEAFADVLGECGIPVIALGDPPVFGKCHAYYFIDYADFYRKAVRYLADEKHERPVFISGETDVMRGGSFIHASDDIERVCKAENVPFGPSRVIRLPWSEMPGSSGYERIADFIAAHADADAIVCDNDIFAEYIQLALLSRKIDMKGRIIITHANRGLDRLMILPVRKIYISADTYASAAVTRMLSLAADYEEPERKAVGIRFDTIES